MTAIDEELIWSGLKIATATEYVPEELNEILSRYAADWEIVELDFIYGKGHHKMIQQRQYEELKEYVAKLEK